MSSPLIKAVGGAVGFAVLWTILAIVSPTTTYHLAPAIVAGVGPVIAPRRAFVSSAATLALALGTTGLLSSLDALAGESLLPVGGAVFESAVAAFGGVAIGFVAMRVLENRAQE